MREILFRGKRISDNTWVYGGIMKTFHPNFTHESSEAFALQKENCYCICANGKDYFVEQESIGQYTGLCDKNGKKIFEGDIVKATTRDERTTTITKIGIGLCKETESDVVCMGVHCTIYNEPYVLPCNDIYHNLIEIIGNIHDNPELLKEGAE